MPALDLYPETLRTTIEAINAVVYENINNASIAAALPEPRQAYEASFSKLFARSTRLKNGSVASAI